LTTVRVTAPAAFSSPIDVTIKQAPASSLAVSPPTRNVAFAAGSTTFNVSNSGGGTLNWNAQVIGGSDWLGISSVGSGVNAGTINLAFTKNAGAQRTGTVRITSDGAATSRADVTIVQSAAPDLLVTPLHKDLGAGPGMTTFGVAVSGGTGVQWSAEIISGNWLGITSDAQGTDAGQIEVSFGSNPAADSRSATIRFSASDAKNSPVEVTLLQSGFAKLDVTVPNGGEIFKLGKKTRIKWLTQGNLPGTVRIELFKYGVFYRTLKQSVVNDGKVGWRVNDVKKGDGYQVRIISEGNESIADMSDSTFMIVK